MPTPSRADPLVRPATTEQYAAVADLTAGVFEREGWAQGSYVEVLRDVAGRAAQAHVLVAADGAAVVGAVAVTTRPGPFAEQAGPGDAVIRMLVTDPAARGRGVGQSLVRACLDLARAEGCTRVLLSTQPGMVAAHRIYQRLGFVRTPAKDWRPEPDVLLLTYALDLLTPPGPGGAAPR